MMEPKSLKLALAEFDRLYVEPASGRPLDQRELAHIIITAICTAIDTGKVEPITSYGTATVQIYSSDGCSSAIGHATDDEINRAWNLGGKPAVLTPEELAKTSVVSGFGKVEPIE